MALIRFSINNPLVTNLMLGIVVILGVLSWRAMPQEMFPTVELDAASIRVEFEGASPEEVERQVSIPIEEEFDGMAEIDILTSSSNEGVASIMIKLKSGTNVDQFMRDAQTALDQVTDLPEEAEEPELVRMKTRFPVISLSLYGDVARGYLYDEADRVKQWWDRVGVEEGEAIENKLLTRVIENAQKKVESRNFDIRKHLLEYDNVMNNQRQAFYSRRREALEREDVHDEVLDMAEGAVVELLDAWWPEKGDPDAEALGELGKALTAHFGVEFDSNAPPFAEGGKPASDREAFGRGLLDRVTSVLEEKKKVCDALAEQYASEGYPRFSDCERGILLQILDAQWKDHLHTMDGLREGIGLRGYASRDPKLEYQREGYALFEEMNARIDTQAIELVFKFALPQPPGEVARRASPLATSWIFSVAS